MPETSPSELVISEFGNISKIFLLVSESLIRRKIHFSRTKKGINNKEILMIGDDIIVDIGGAQDLNLQTCLVKTGKYGKQLYPKSLKPHYLLPKLSSVKRLLS